MQTPTIGRTVHYVLSAEDAAAIEAARSIRPGVKGNPVQEGTLCAAIITAVWSPTTVNLQVILDGPDSHWALSRLRHNEELKSPCPGGYWTFPARS